MLLENNNVNNNINQVCALGMTEACKEGAQSTTSPCFPQLLSVLETTAFKCKAPVVKMKTPILDFFIWLSVYPTSSLKRKLWPFRGAQKSLQASTVQLEPAPAWPRVVQTLHVTSWRHVNPSHSRLGFWAPGIISWLTHTPQHCHEPALLEWDSTFSRSTHEYTLPTQGSPRNHLMYPG